MALAHLSHLIDPNYHQIQQSLQGKFKHSNIPLLLGFLGTEGLPQFHSATVTLIKQLNLSQNTILTSTRRSGGTFSHMILTATVCVVMLVGTRRTGSQTLAALGAQQGQLGATGLAVEPAGTGGTGRPAGCGGEEGDEDRF